MRILKKYIIETLHRISRLIKNVSLSVNKSQTTKTLKGKQLNLLFYEIIKDTKPSNPKALYLAINLGTKSIINYELHSGLCS